MNYKEEMEKCDKAIKYWDRLSRYCEVAAVFVILSAVGVLIYYLS